MEGECNWYHEANELDEWDLPDHQLYLKKAEDMMKTYNLKEDEIYKVMDQIANMNLYHPGVRKLILYFINMINTIE